MVKPINFIINNVLTFPLLNKDQRRMNDIVSYLIKLRISPEKMEKLKQKEVCILSH